MRATLVTVVAVAMILALAPTASGQASPSDAVVANLSNSGSQPGAEPSLLTIDAHSGPGGEIPTGTGLWTLPEGGIGRSFSVTCLAVSGNTAVIGFSGTIFNIPDYPGSGDFGIGGLVRVIDGGGPNSGQDTFEWAEHLDLDGGLVPGPTDCSEFPSRYLPLGFAPVYRTGDLVVSDDVLSFPATKAECKNGGWRNYGDMFKNQGACGSFVATGGKRKS